MNAHGLAAVAVAALLLGGALAVAPAPTAAPFVPASFTPEPAEPSPASCTPRAFAGAGTRGPRSGSRGPALMLAGAGLSNVPASTLPWIRAHVRGAASGRAGNVVVLKASGDERDYTERFYGAARFRWVQEVLVPPCATAAQVDATARYVENADVVLFAGGDQAHYAAWKDSALIRAVRRVYARGGIVGGGSAGLAIQGEIAYDSVAADRLHPGDDDWNVTTANATADPLEPEISFTRELFDWTPLRATITDTHFAKRDRLGRLVTFLARIGRDRAAGSPAVYGLGVDEGSVVLVEPDGTATVRNRRVANRGAYLLRLVHAAPLSPGSPLRATVAISHIARDGERFDLGRRRTGEPWRDVAVDGSRAPPYAADPYR